MSGLTARSVVAGFALLLGGCVIDGVGEPQPPEGPSGGRGGSEPSTDDAPELPEPEDPAGPFDDPSVYSDCIGERDGFFDCEEYCFGVGLLCDPGGCDGTSWIGWSPDRANACASLAGATASGTRGCQQPIPWHREDIGVVRCCCAFPG